MSFEQIPAGIKSDPRNDSILQEAFDAEIFDEVSVYSLEIGILLACIAQSLSWAELGTLHGEQAALKLLKQSYFTDNSGLAWRMVTSNNGDMVRMSELMQNGKRLIAIFVHNHINNPWQQENKLIAPGVMDWLSPSEQAAIERSDLSSTNVLAVTHCFRIKNEISLETSHRLAEEAIAKGGPPLIDPGNICSQMPRLMWLYARLLDGNPITLEVINDLADEKEWLVEGLLDAIERSGFVVAKGI